METEPPGRGRTGPTVEIHRGVRFVVSRGCAADGRARVFKAVRPGPRASASAARLRGEYAMLRELRVPGVGRALALEEGADGLPVLVLEDAGPQNLAAWLRRQPLALERFFVLAVQLAEALARLHELRVIHRDVNPTNVVVSGDGARATLVDFDLATHVAGAQARGVTGELEGSLPYIAPEQTGRTERPVDHRADLYALGATLYEMLTGAPPFVAADPAELVHAHLARAPVAPARANPAVPRVLSDLVLRLLAKAPEQRYQSADALAADLREAQRRWQADREIAPFELGRLDRARELVLPGRLYGRDDELARLEAALARVRAGARELVVVRGPAGVGKSALVDALRPRVEPQGRFLAGKFDALRGNAPYAPVADAFRGLVRGLLREPEEELRAWRARIEDTLGATARAVTDVVPELAAMLGEPPPLPAVGAAETETRFLVAFCQFVKTLATAERPLVLVLDDLQWADAASLKLLQHVATTPGVHHVLLLGTVRDGETDGDALAPTLAAVRSAGGPVQTLEVRPLTLPALGALCSDVLRGARERCAPLAALVLEKTAGNPLFVERFLRYLHGAGLLVFDTERGAWDWDPDQIARVEVTENVVELMVATIRRLPEETQWLLEAAACLPDQIDLALLAELEGRPAGETARRLWGALREGLLVPADARQAPPGARGDGAGENATYRFVHDRVRQAAYSLLTDDARKALHLAIGRRLLARAPGPALEARVFDVADQLDRGADLLTTAPERSWLAELNLRAGRRAATAAAFGPALAYFDAGLALLPAEAWRSDYALWFGLHRGAAECAYLADEWARAEALIEAALAHAEAPLDKAELYGVRGNASAARDAYGAALRWLRAGLALLGVALPEGDFAQAAADECAALAANLGGRAPADLLALPVMQDPVARASMRLLSDCTSPAWFTDMALLAFLCARMVNVSLRHGNASQSAHAYAVQGVTSEAGAQDYATGYAFGSAGVELSRRFHDARSEARTLTTFALLENHWRAPMRSALPLLRRAIDAGLASGEWPFVGYALGGIRLTLAAAGAELARLQAHCDDEVAQLRGLGASAMTTAAAFAERRAVRLLRGGAGAASGPDGPDDDADGRAMLARIRARAGEHWQYCVERLRTAWLLGDYAQAREWVRAADERAAHATPLVLLVEHALYAALTAAVLPDAAPPAQRAEAVARIAPHRRRLETWAENCPENFRHLAQLVAAEVARLEARPLDEVLALYDAAIDGAHRGEFVHHEAIANERAGRACLARGRRRIAGTYVRAALEAYARWGAGARAAALEEEFQDLAAAETIPLGVAPGSEETGGASLDLLSMLKAAETLSSEVKLDRLLEKLMAVSLEVAGAQRGALVLELEPRGALAVHAVGAASEPVALERVPLAEATNVPRALIEQAYRTGEAVVLADAARHGAFVVDPYIAARGVRSALVVPLRRSGRTTGVLYLENNLASRAFVASRVRVLTLLSSQVAIALENSLLYEARVRAERGARFLAEASAALSESLDYATTLAKVVRLAVPFLADWCTVDVVGHDGTLEPVAAAHADPAKDAALREFRARRARRPAGEELASAAVLRREEPFVLIDVDDARLAATLRDPRDVALVRAFGVRWALFTRLSARERVLGALSLFRTETAPRYGPDDVALARELARRAALSIDNARLYQESQEAIRLREEFVSVASHELNTPIAALQLAVQSIARRHDPALPPPVQRSLQVVERQAWRLASLVGEMLDVSRVQGGRLHLTLEDVDLAATAREVADRLGGQLSRAQCPVVLRADEPVVGRWDRTRLEQVLTNLLSNAMKFGAHHPIEVTVAREGGLARLVVADHGIGIPPERIPFIFGRFERGVSAQHYGGLGLGLYIVNEIVAALGGTVRVDSAVSEGSTFTVELPAAAAPSDARASAPARG